MNFKTLDRYLREYTDGERIQKMTGQLYFVADINAVREYERTHTAKDDIRVDTVLNPVLPDLHFSITKVDRFAMIPTHTRSWVTIQYVYSGECYETVNGQELFLQEGQFLCLDRDVAHAMQSLGENDIVIHLLIEHEFCTKYLESHFSEFNEVTHWIASLLSDRISHDRYVIGDETPSLNYFMRYFMCRYFSPTTNASIVFDSILALILTEITEISEKDSFLGVSFSSDNTAVILQYITNHFRSCTLQSTADFFQISPNYLTRLIKKRTGLSYKQLIQRLKLQYAETMLINTQMSIDTICHDAGYENRSHFYQLFAEKHGCTPKEYRQKRIHE